jgi:hypothetical protein
LAAALPRGSIEYTHPSSRLITTCRNKISFSQLF